MDCATLSTHVVTMLDSARIRVRTVCSAGDRVVCVQSSVCNRSCSFPLALVVLPQSSSLIGLSQGARVGGEGWRWLHG